MVYSDDGGFWDRESGLFCQGFRSLGQDSKLVALGNPGLATKAPVHLGSLEDLMDPGFWRKLNPTGVVFYSWAVPKYEPIARAIKESGAKLVLKLDSDGVKSPRVSFWLQLVRAIYSSRDIKKPLPTLYGIAHTILLRLFPSLHDEKMIRHLEHADVIGIECPVAQARLRRLLRGYGREDLARRVEVIPHPVTADAVQDPAIPRERCIIAVGRWSSWQKDAPMLIRVLAATLAAYPAYSAELYGSGGDILQRLIRDLPAEICGRVKIGGSVDHSALIGHFQRSRILFMPSRFEGFPNTASEAVCCGCSVVGPAQLSALVYLGGKSSGTLAPYRTFPHLRDALEAEICEWEAGHRDPAAISRSFLPELSLRSVIEKTLRVSGKTPGAPVPSR